MRVEDSPAAAPSDEPGEGVPDLGDVLLAEVDLLRRAV
jgi:hypothetical protein